MEIEKRYYSSEQMKYEIPYINGKEHGLEKWWNSNGQIRYEFSYKNDLQCGAMILFEY